MRPCNAPIRRGQLLIGPYMTQRQRKLAGTIALIVMIAVYALLALAAAIVLQVREVGWFGELAFYVVAGLLWTLPAGLLIKWMQKPGA